MAQNKLTDPISSKTDNALEVEDQDAMAGIMDGDDIDFHPTPEKYARAVHPFDGYPERKVVIGQANGKPVKVFLSSLVRLSPGTYIVQDPSGEKVSHIDPSTKVETFQDLATYHNRVVRDSTGRNTDVVFDRTVTFDNGKSFDNVAIVPDHTARAQLIYKVDPKTSRVIVDRRYGVFDVNQLGRLRQVFNSFHYQQTSSERAAAKFDEEASSSKE